MYSIKNTFHIDGLVQERCNSMALAMELRLSCTNPWYHCMKLMKHSMLSMRILFLIISHDRLGQLIYWGLVMHIYSGKLHYYQFKMAFYILGTKYELNPALREEDFIDGYSVEVITTLRCCQSGKFSWSHCLWFCDQFGPGTQCTNGLLDQNKTCLRNAHCFYKKNNDNIVSQDWIIQQNNQNRSQWPSWSKITRSYFVHLGWIITCGKKSMIYTVWCRYNAVNFLTNIRKRHPTAGP